MFGEHRVDGFGECIIRLLNPVTCRTDSGAAETASFQPCSGEFVVGLPYVLKMLRRRRMTTCLTYRRHNGSWHVREDGTFLALNEEQDVMFAKRNRL